MNPPLILFAICPTCRRKAQLVFLGIQAGFEELPAVTLYNCSVCGSTVAGHHIVDVEVREVPCAARV